MKQKTLSIATFGLAFLMVVAMGCQTVPRGAALGGALGAGTGAIIGAQSGHAGEGAAIGAVVGAATGAIASDIRARRTKSAQETAKAYDYEPAQGEVLKLESVSVLPSQVKPGDMVEASIQYALLGTGEDGVAVRESRSLMQGQGGQIVAEIGTKNFTRQDGTWVSVAQFKVLDNLEPGEVTVQQVIETNQSRISGSAKFTVIE
ncbi:MAG: YMGG-like glycine zipper-containing protein [Candidatus Hydrogenedentota bacterium]